MVDCFVGQHLTTAEVLVIRDLDPVGEVAVVEPNSIQLLNRRSRKHLPPVERNTRVAVPEPDEARFGRLGGEEERASVVGVRAGRGEDFLAEKPVQWPVASLASGAAVVDALTGAAALEGGGGVADGAEGWGGGGYWWGDGEVVFEEEGGAEVLGVG